MSITIQPDEREIVQMGDRYYLRAIYMGAPVLSEVHPCTDGTFVSHGTATSTRYDASGQLLLSQ